MNSKGHMLFSFAKSILRIIACALCLLMKSVAVLAIGIGVAEILGFAEELVDQR